MEFITRSENYAIGGDGTLISSSISLEEVCRDLAIKLKKSKGKSKERGSTIQRLQERINKMKCSPEKEDTVDKLRARLREELSRNASNLQTLHEMDTIVRKLKIIKETVSPSDVYDKIKRTANGEVALPSSECLKLIPLINNVPFADHIAIKEDLGVYKVKTCFIGSINPNELIEDGATLGEALTKTVLNLFDAGLINILELKRCFE
jgi:hypothetical protein